MPDIQLRFNKDMLVLSSPIDASLRAQGVDVDVDRELFNILEPESVCEAFRLESIAGAPCLVTNTNGITEARLTHAQLEDRAAEFAHAAVYIAQKMKPQHVLAEIGPTNLPIDPSSPVSLKANRDQYAAAARLFADEGIDAIFLNGMVSLDDMRCALMGVRMVCDLPIVASMKVDAEGIIEGRATTLEEAVDLMREYEASVIGFETAAGPADAARIARRAVKAASGDEASSPAPATTNIFDAAAAEQEEATGYPVLIQLSVGRVDKKSAPDPSNPYACADNIMAAADALRAAGVQFLRASGNATPAYTGALVAAVMGLDVVK